MLKGIAIEISSHSKPIKGFLSTAMLNMSQFHLRQKSKVHIMNIGKKGIVMKISMKDVVGGLLCTTLRNVGWRIRSLLVPCGRSVNLSNVGLRQPTLV